VDRLLAANGHHAAHADSGPVALADAAAARPGVEPDLRAAAPPADRSVPVCELAARPESARAARDFTRLTLREWQLERLTDVAELVVSELVTNALRHGLLSARWMPGEHPIRLRLLRQDPYLMCMVSDPDPAGPVRMDSHVGAESGRGLQVVESYSVRWGWQLLDAGAPGASSPDAGASHASTPDERALDARALDARALDARALDARVPDSRAPDAEALEARALDAQALDARAFDGPSGKVVWALLQAPEFRRISSRLRPRIRRLK